MQASHAIPSSLHIIPWSALHFLAFPRISIKPWASDRRAHAHPNPAHANERAISHACNVFGSIPSWYLRVDATTKPRIANNHLKHAQQPARVGVGYPTSAASEGQTTCSRVKGNGHTIVSSSGVVCLDDDVRRAVARARLHAYLVSPPTPLRPGKTPTPFPPGATRPR